DYTVSTDVLFTRAGSSAGVLDRFSDQGGGGIDNFRGYILRLSDDGSWQLLKNSRYVGVSILASGVLAVPVGHRDAQTRCRTNSGLVHVRGDHLARPLARLVKQSPFADPAASAGSTPVWAN